MVGRFERNKDLLQEVVESTAAHVGRIATIITGAVVDVTREIGDLISDGVEMREAAKKAQLDDRHAVHNESRLDELADRYADDDPDDEAPDTDDKDAHSRR
ncbi:hypothetical protein [Williamsia sp. CHRR-6]|uniref:hypothetical protein n=1 Tax=Williamsia sp. CHRR-6 TaxID=2835871 RepID=UPI0020248721|nr:hypothetical protein [Williamsia sp. CHRR-6]